MNAVIRLFVLGILLYGASASAMDWYVSPTGRDTNPGTFTSPFQTIQRGLTNRMPGDRIIARAGTYVLSTSSGLIEAVPIIPYMGESVFLQIPNQMPVALDQNVILWTDIKPVVATVQPDVRITLRTGAKLSSVRLTRRAGDTSTAMYCTINKSTTVTVETK